MGFINVNLKDVKETKSVPAGRYRLVVSSWEETESKEKKTPQLKFSIVIEGHDDAMPVNHYVPLPTPKDEPKSANFKALLLARFLALFSIPNSGEGFNPDDAIGCTADAELQLGEANAAGDSYNQLVVPKLRTEGQGSAPGTAAKAVGAKKR